MYVLFLFFFCFCFVLLFVFFGGGGVFDLFWKRFTETTKMYFLLCSSVYTLRN